MATKVLVKDGKLATYGGKVVKVEATGAEAIEWHQCPEPVRNYLANVSYDPSDYSTSQIANYAPAIAVVSNYKPIGREAGGATYYNEVPNVLTPFVGTGAAGTLKPLDALRWLNTPQAANVRDLGGWACDGGTVRYGLLFRGGEITTADRDVLVGACGVRHELNLRGAEEANRTTSPLGSDVWFYCPTNFVWYSLTDKTTWKEILLYVIKAVTHNEPVYFHCSAGADRTGTVACLLEALLGMSRSDIDKDYELTCFSTGTDTDAHARRRNETDWKNLITAINQYTGSSFRDKAVSFVTACGVPISKVNAYRAAMSSGTPETLTGGTHTVTLNLTHVSSSNAATTVEDQGSYTATLTADADYTTTLSPTGTYKKLGAIIVTMGGTDISASAVSGSTITISKVTGNIVITCAAAITNIIDTIGISADTRLSTSSGANRTQVGYAAIGANMDASSLIHLKAGDTLRIKGASLPASNDNYSAIALHNASGTFNTSIYLHNGLTWNNMTFNNTDGGVIITSGGEHYFRVSMICTDASKVVATINEAIE